jgi:hypothetical protein
MLAMSRYLCGPNAAARVLVAGQVKGLGGSAPLPLQFFHRALLFRHGVLIHLVKGGQVKDFEFSPE